MAKLTSYWVIFMIGIVYCLLLMEQNNLDRYRDLQVLSFLEYRCTGFLDILFHYRLHLLGRRQLYYLFHITAIRLELLLLVNRSLLLLDLLLVVILGFGNLFFINIDLMTLSFLLNHLN